MNKAITLLIPTKNRSEFLVRLLKYYKGLGFEGFIRIVDGSDGDHAQQTMNALKFLRRELRVDYQSCPTLSYRATLKKLIESVSTPYVALNMDDDFLVPSSLKECAEFLENNPDYSAARGIGAMFSLDSAGAYGEVNWVGRYPQRVVEADTARQRLLDYFSAPFVSVFSVHRTQVWQAIHRDVVLEMDWFFADELLPCCLAAIHGKMKELDCFYLAFQNHNQRTRHPDFFNIVTSTTWASSYRLFRDFVAGELARCDGMSVEEACEVVKKGFWLLLARGLTSKWQARYGLKTENHRSWLRNTLGHIPGSRSAWRALRSVISNNRHELSLEALLQPASPYHADFMPIYRAVTSPDPTKTDYAGCRQSYT